MLSISKEVIPCNYRLKIHASSLIIYVFTVNGTSPENGEIIEAKLCYKYGSSCCDRYADLQMKNCSGSLVLNITSKPSCLCGGTCYSTLIFYQYMIQGYTPDAFIYPHTSFTYDQKIVSILLIFYCFFLM